MCILYIVCMCYTKCVCGSVYHTAIIICACGYYLFLYDYMLYNMFTFISYNTICNYKPISVMLINSKLKQT